MNNFQGKKILILGGASVHVKLVRAAQEMGAYVYVTDNVDYEESPGKKIANEYWDINIYDIDKIVEASKRNNIQAVIAGWLDPCQIPYAEVCKRLDLPCYGDEAVFFRMTNKRAFKDMCKSYGVDTIPEFSIKDAIDGKVDFPIFIKPVDSRGSRGQSVCYKPEEVGAAIEFAKTESSNGDVIIEKYIRGRQEFHVTYFFIDGEPYLLRTSDNYCGSEVMHMEKVVSCAVMPSRYTKVYLETAHHKVVNMFKNLGIKNGPIFMQGFMDDGVFRFFDPGLRFPGVDFELVFKRVFGIDLMKAMVQLAFNNKCDVKIPSDAVYLDMKRAAVLYLTVREGYISRIAGEEKVRNYGNVISYLPRCKTGDRIKWSYNVNQRLAEVDLLADNTEELINAIDYVHNSIIAEDECGNDIIFARFNTNRIDN